MLAEVADWKNLRLAVAKAARGKHHRPEVRAFLRSRTEELDRLRRELLDQSYRVSPYRQFVVLDPKRRIIHAAAFRDRVLHHAILNVVEPDFERRLIHDTFACRTGKGKHLAWQRAQQFAARFRYYAKLDVRKYFDSIDHAILRGMLRRVFKDHAFLQLLDRILASHAARPGKGVPIGTLLSQHWANHYLGALDRHVKEALGVPGYLRYMDDFVLFSDRSAAREAWVESVRAFSRSVLCLDLKPVRWGICREGVPFLGGRVLPGGVLPDRRTRRRFALRLRQYQQERFEGRLSERGLQRRLDALFGSLPPRARGAWHLRAIADSEEGLLP